MIDEESFEACSTYDAVDEREVIAALPEVEAVSLGSFRALTLAPVDDPDRTWMTTSRSRPRRGAGSRGCAA
ncbi:MAG: hypothetical protein ABWZ52_04630 [Acidimicrobiales bacterium]